MTDVTIDETTEVAIKTRAEDAKPRRPGGMRDIAQRHLREIAHRVGVEAVARALDQAA